jgi:nitrate/nitrite transport system substrate-binding protein
MLLNTHNFTDTQWEQWEESPQNRKNSRNLALKCSVCGQFHEGEKHSTVMTDLPSQPEALIDDLIKMGLYDRQSLEIANSISNADLQKALFLKVAGRGNPKRERLVNELIRQAGGLDEAFAAAFGPKSGDFFNDTISNSHFTRRRFLRNVAIGAALVALASCNNQKESIVEEETLITPATLEKTNLTISFLPITCATPIIMSEPLGFYQRYGLNVELKKYPSWVVVRDDAIAGKLDAFHMLAPMPIAMTLGLDGTAFSTHLASIENTNGQGVVVANKYKDKIKSAADFKGFTIGVPYYYSNHNLIMRYYLAGSGLNPNTDVKIVVLPPPQAIAKMKTGEVDAFLMPDNFAQRAVYDNLGFIYTLSKDIWQNHPCCAFAAGDSWIKQHPNTFRALNKAIIEAAGYARNATNRIEVARAISEEKYLNQPIDVLEAVMTGTFQDGLGNTKTIPDRIDFDPYPWQSFATWISTQLVRWDYLPTEKANYQQIGEQIFLTDLARELAEEIGAKPPEELLKVENLKFDQLDPKQPQDYLQTQIDRFGV